MDNTAPALTVLLVEDSQDDAFFFTRSMNKVDAFCSFSHITDEAAALKFIQRTAAEAGHCEHLLVFLDLKTPGLSGFEVLRQVRACGLQCEVVVLSGSNLEALKKLRELNPDVRAVIATADI